MTGPYDNVQGPAHLLQRRPKFPHWVNARQNFLRRVAYRPAGIKALGFMKPPARAGNLIGAFYSQAKVFVRECYEKGFQVTVDLTLGKTGMETMMGLQSVAFLAESVRGRHARLSDR